MLSNSRGFTRANLRRDLSGFTLIELLIVIVVIGILTGTMILVMNPITQHNKARDGLVVTNLGKLGQAIEAYQAAEGSYPATFEDGDNGDYVKN